MGLAADIRARQALLRLCWATGRALLLLPSLHVCTYIYTYIQYAYVYILCISSLHATFPQGPPAHGRVSDVWLWLHCAHWWHNTNRAHNLSSCERSEGKHTQPHSLPSASPLSIILWEFTVLHIGFCCNFPPFCLLLSCDKSVLWPLISGMCHT